MPLCFQFILNDEIMSLDDIDREICEEFEQSYSSTNYSIHYQVITMMGLAILARQKVDPITSEAFDAYIAVNKDVYPDEEQNAKFKKFLCEKYKFTGWFQRHK